jgi:hypothetical protein
MDAKATQQTSDPPKPRRPRGRQRGSHVTPGLNRPGARKDFVRLGELTGPSRFFAKMVRDITADCGGTRSLSRIESELIRIFCGVATLAQTMNADIALGETSEINVSDYANLASTMLRLSSRLGIKRRPRDVTTLDQFLDDINKNRMAHDEAAQPRQSSNDEAAQLPPIFGDHVVQETGNDDLADEL